MKRISKFIALLLTITMLLTIIPSQVFAEENQDTTASEPTVLPEDYVNGTRTEESGKKLSNIVAEDLELREGSVKHFRCEDGTYVAASYPTPVHYEENGQWKDIDNSMVLQEPAAPQAFSMDPTAPQASGSYVNTSSDISVALPETLSENTNMTLDFGENPISFGLLCPNQVQGQVIADGPQVSSMVYSALSEEAVQDTNYKEYLTISNLTSGVKYENAYPNTDVEYIVSPLGIKENIIIKSAQESYSYTYHIAANGLTLVLNEDKSVTAFDAQDKPVYTVETPYMFDSNGNESYDVAVTLDPSIIVEMKKTNIFDTYVTSSEPTNNCSTRSYFTVGYNSLGLDRAYLKFDVPELPHCSMINYASLNLAKLDYDGAASGTIYAYLYEMGTAGAGQTTNTDTMTWDTQPTAWLSGNVIDYTKMEANKSVYSWNITSLAKKWYEDGNNTGVAIKSSNESFVRKVRFYSCNISSAYDSLYPTVIVQYTNNIGLEDYWTYHSIDNGRSGVSSINDYNGSLVHVHQDIAMNGNRMPINVSHVYNMDKNEEDYYNGGYMSTGVGWRLNIRERIVELTQNPTLYQPLIDRGYTHKYFDPDGTVKFFKTKNNVWVYEYDDSLKLAIEGGPTAVKRYAMSDDSGNIKYFDYNGRLRGIKDSNGNEQTINYTNGKLTSIVDPVGRQVTFGYTGILLTSITDPSGRATTYSYTPGNNKSYLTKITYPDGKFTSFTYDTNDNLTEIKGIDNAKTTFEYKNVIVPTKTTYRIKKAQFYGTAGTLQNQYSYTYSPYSTKVADNFNKSETMMFDNAGRTVSVKDQNNRAYYGKYNETGNQNNTLKYQSNMQQSIVNFALNHSAERDGENWYWNAIGGVTGSQSITTAEHKYGNKAFKVTSNTQTGRITYRQDLSIPNDRTYTFSAYVKTENLTTTGGGAFLAFVYQDEDTKEYHAEMGQLIEETEGWERYSVTCTVGPDKTTNAGLMMGLLNAQGTVYFDGIQAEFGSVANHYNMIENTGMELKTDNVPRYWVAEDCQVNKDNPTASIDGCALEGNGNSGGFKMTGAPDKNKKLYQDVEVNGNKGDTLIVGAWAKHNSVMRDGDSPEKSCAIVVCVEYKEPYNANGDVLAFDEFYFDSLSTEFQYLTGSVTTLGAYETVRVFLRYRSNMNKVVFDDVQLHVDNYGTKYEYDDKGRIVSKKDSAGQEYKYTYTGPDIGKLSLKRMVLRKPHKPMNMIVIIM